MPDLIFSSLLIKYNNISYVEIPNVEPNPKLSHVKNAIKLLKDLDLDVNTPFYHPKFIACDACTARSGFCNVVVIEDERIEENVTQ